MHACVLQECLAGYQAARDLIIKYLSCNIMVSKLCKITWKRIVDLCKMQTVNLKVIQMCGCGERKIFVAQTSQRLVGTFQH